MCNLVGGVGEGPEGCRLPALDTERGRGRTKVLDAVELGRRSADTAAWSGVGVGRRSSAADCDDIGGGEGRPGGLRRLPWGRETLVAADLEPICSAGSKQISASRTALPMDRYPRRAFGGELWEGWRMRFSGDGGVSKTFAGGEREKERSSRGGSVS